MYGRDAFDYFAKHPALMQKAIPTDLRSSHAITMWEGMQPSQINKLVGMEIYDPNPASAFLQNQLYINKARANVEHLQRVSTLTGITPTTRAVVASSKLSSEPSTNIGSSINSKYVNAQRSLDDFLTNVHSDPTQALSSFDDFVAASRTGLRGIRLNESVLRSESISSRSAKEALGFGFFDRYSKRLAAGRDIVVPGTRGRGTLEIVRGGRYETIGFETVSDVLDESSVRSVRDYLASTIRYSEAKSDLRAFTHLRSTGELLDDTLSAQWLTASQSDIDRYFELATSNVDIIGRSIEPDRAFAENTLDTLRNVIRPELSSRMGATIQQRATPLAAKTVIQGENVVGDIAGYSRFQNAPGGIDTFLPTGVYDELNKVRDVRRGPIETMFAKGMAKWKQSVTTIFPAFFTRNITGGVLWQNILAGVGLRDYRANIEIGINTANSRFVPKWIQGDPNIAKYDLGGDRLFTATEARATMARTNTIGVEGIADLDLAKANQLGIWGAFNRAQEMAMVGSENFLRGPVFLKNMREGAGEAASAAAVKKYHFDYTQGALTDWEERFARPFIPFYRWARSNIPLQTESLFEQPGTFAGLAKYKLSTERENRNRLNRFDQTKAGLFFGDTYIGTELPVADLPGSYSSSDAYFAINPFIKLAEGLLTGRDPVTGRSLDTYHASLRLPDDESGDARYAFTGRAGFIANTAFGRIISAGAEVQRSARGERPWTYTLGHQIGGLTVRDASANVNGFDGYLGVSPTESLGGYTPDVTSSGFSQSYTNAEFHTQFNAHLEDSNRIQANGSGSSRSNDAYFKQRFNIEMREHNRVMARGVR